MKRCKICSYVLRDYDKECDTCGACINQGHECSCGEGKEWNLFFEYALKNGIESTEIEDFKDWFDEEESFEDNLGRLKDHIDFRQNT